MVSTDNPNPLETINTLPCMHFDGAVGDADHVILTCDEPRRGRYYHSLTLYQRKHNSFYLSIFYASIRIHI